MPFALLNGLSYHCSSSDYIDLQITLDVAALSLYDICIFCDDSGSMAFEEGVSCCSLIQQPLAACKQGTHSLLQTSPDVCVSVAWFGLSRFGVMGTRRAINWPVRCCFAAGGARP